MNAEAIHQLASVIKLQSDWVRYRSTSLYTDPFLLEEKIRRASKKELANIFLKAWRPIVELEQISPPYSHARVHTPEPIMDMFIIYPCQFLGYS